eukprot:TRINITY_DN11935_c0_g1_i1.p1 TRINITY_DN11935_c0_g1~~TRINITY_DN11935_c0_g1_i1.p1  ORF type:complete len:311 (+),score=37.05 TRINITY_DN11935_c0_g1_i1:133-933(+)
MFPVDTIKTHMQAHNTSLTFRQTGRQIYQTGGTRALFRGMTAIMASAAPAHAVYFTMYEYFRRLFGANSGDPSLALGLAGACATIISDGILAPGDTIKQRCQISNNYRNPLACARHVIQREGYRALWAGYTTTIVMNVPFHAIYLNVYEPLRKFLVVPSEKYDIMAHVVAGGGAGVVAACLTNPLDVTRTRLQTRGDIGKAYVGMFPTLREIYVNEGMRGFFLGVQPRMLFHSVSAGVLWGSYEYFKFVFGASDIPPSDSLEPILP